MEPTFFRPRVDDQSAYRDAIARAEAAAAEVLVDDRGRTPDIVVAPESAEAVLVQASDQPLPPEETPGTPAAAVVEDTPVVVPPVVAEETPEQKIARLEEELERRNAQLTEKESMIGRQSIEVGEVRAEIAALREEVATRTPQPPVAAPIVITQEMIEDDPARASQIAYQQNDPAALERAFSYWKEIDPFTAASWRSDTLAQQREAAIRAEIQQDRERVQAEKQRAAQVSAAWSGAMNDVGAVYPDLLQVDETGRSNAERLLTEVAPQYPRMLEILRDGDQQAKAEVLKALYVVDRSNRTDPAALAAQLEEAAAQAAAEEAAARRAAATVIGQPNTGQDPVPQTEEQREQAAYAARAGHRPSLERGWTGRSA